MLQPIVLIGAGRNVFDVLDVLDAINDRSLAWRVLGVVDDHREVGSNYLGLTVLGPLASARAYEDSVFISTIWNDKAFRDLGKILGSTGVPINRYATLCHPAALVSKRATLGRNVLVHFAASVAGNVNVSDHVSIGPGCAVGHDTTIGSYSCIAAGAILGGGVQIGANCYIGSGAMIRQTIKVGAGAVVGMGAVVVKEVLPYTTVAGNPAGPLVRAPH